MRVLIVHAHPEPKSFNGALTTAAAGSLREAGHEVLISDLYQSGFNPVSGRHNFTSVKDPFFFKQQQEELFASSDGGFAADVAAEMERLFWCDALILQFPLWWFGMPAILKGWVDRVFAMGLTYGNGRWFDRGVFSGKRAVCSLTTGGPAHSYTARGRQGELRLLLFPVHHGMLRFTGFDVLPPNTVYGPARMTPEERESALGEWRKRVRGLFDEAPIAFASLDEFGADGLLMDGRAHTF